MKMVAEQEVQPLAWPIPQAAKRAGYGETKFRELIKAGEVGYIENGDRKLVTDEEIKRLHRAKLKFSSEAA